MPDLAPHEENDERHDLSYVHASDPHAFAAECEMKGALVRMISKRCVAPWFWLCDV